MDLSTATVTAFSSASAYYAEWKAVDGISRESQWYSAGGGVQYLRLALAQVAYVMAGVLYPGTEDSDGHRPTGPFLSAVEVVVKNFTILTAQCY